MAILNIKRLSDGVAPAPQRASTPPRPVTIPTPPRRTTSAPKPGGTGKTTTGNTTSGKTSSGGTSSKATDPYAKARADQLADQKKAEKKAETRLLSQAERLKKQAEALKIALSSTGFHAVLRRELGNATLEFDEENALILAQYARGKSALEQQAETAEDSRVRSLQESGQNASRERNEALQQGIANGVGATDMLRAQTASLRNWSFNVGQVQANYTDELNSLQSEHSQMVNSVVTARSAAWREREQQRSQLYRSYYDNRGQVFTEMGNKLGEASQYYDMANEQVESKTTQSKMKAAEKSALQALRNAAKQTGQGYTEKATPNSITKWQGSARIENSTDARQWGQPVLEMKDAEGATLRKWEQ